MIDPERAQEDRDRRTKRLQEDDYWNGKREPKDTKVDKHVLRERRLGRVSAPFDWEQVLKIYGHRCGLCCVSVHDEPMTVDHIIPLSRGGGNWSFNLRPACERCNNSKGSSLDAECWVGREQGTVDWR